MTVKNLLICAVMAMLVGCASSGDNSDLRAYIQNIKSRPQGAIEPLPPVRTFDPFIYAATALRSPFDEPVAVAVVTGESGVDIKPDFRRPKEFLESFTLDSLAMVGSLEQNGALWSLVKDPSGGIHRVATNSYLGKNHGRIISATPTQIDLLEIVSDGLGGWVQRPRTIKLSEKE